MHDIVHDFVRFLVKDEILEKENESGLLDLSSVKPHHLILSNSNKS